MYKEDSFFFFLDFSSSEKGQSAFAPHIEVKMDSALDSTSCECTVHKPLITLDPSISCERFAETRNLLVKSAVTIIPSIQTFKRVNLKETKEKMVLPCFVYQSYDIPCGQGQNVSTRNLVPALGHFINSSLGFDHRIKPISSERKVIRVVLLC